VDAAWRATRFAFVIDPVRARQNALATHDVVSDGESSSATDLPCVLRRGLGERILRSSLAGACCTMKGLPVSGLSLTVALAFHTASKSIARRSINLA
jgi:hypothetical protein